MNKFLKLMLFIFVAVPGLLIMLAFSIDLLAAIFAPKFCKSPIIDLIVIFISMLMILVGVGKWKQWRYLLVFASIPIALFAVIFFQDICVKCTIAKGAFVGNLNYLSALKILPALVVGLIVWCVAKYILKHKTQNKIKESVGVQGNVARENERGIRVKSRQSTFER